MANDAKVLNNLTQDCTYAFLPNGCIINLGEWLKCSFTTGIAYAISSYTTLGLLKSSSTPILDEIEVMTMTQEVRDLGTRLNILDEKYDKKIDGISVILRQEFKEISASLKNIDGRLGIIESKVTGIQDRTANWKLFVLLPLITTTLGGIVTAVVMKIFIP